MRWQPDSLLDGYESYTWAIPDAVLAEGEPDGDLTATLVRRVQTGAAGRPAVLYVHGWSDYFFQAHVGDVFDGFGYDFYALDLRRYGRNLRPGLLAGYVPNLDDYDAEIDEAMRIIKEDHASVVLMGHSTGGLTTALWAARHPGEITGLILNSPWLDMTGSPLVWAMGQALLTSLSAISPTRSVSTSGSSFSRRALHRSEEGEWDFDLNLKTSPGFIVRYAWTQAILAGHDKVAAGLDIDVPALVITSGASKFTRHWDESLRTVDFVLDVGKIAAAAHNLGKHVTLVRITDALHDVTLSPAPIRAKVFDECDRWLGAYVERDAS